MQIEIDFDVYQALTLLRQNEEDSYSSVLRRILHLGTIESAQFKHLSESFCPKAPNFLGELLEGNYGRKGAWLNNVFFPEGTDFRATYKGQTFRARIEKQAWVGADGIVRKSPSEAAGAISDTNVNGWKFWYAKRPSDNDWHRLDEFRK